MQTLGPPLGGRTRGCSRCAAHFSPRHPARAYGAPRQGACRPQSPGACAPYAPFGAWAPAVVDQRQGWAQGRWAAVGCPRAAATPAAGWGKRSASGRRHYPCGQGGCEVWGCGQRSCPHVHADPPLVHRAEQACSWCTTDCPPQALCPVTRRSLECFARKAFTGVEHRITSCDPVGDHQL